MKFNKDSISNIKIIIWDLDDTFWKGVLSDNSVEIEKIDRNIELVKQLARRGIVNSICSKNDYMQAVEKLEEFGVAEYFVFKSINWDAKGIRIKDMLDAMSLRPKNALFIDDNETNLAEVEYVQPDINVSTPECLSTIYENIGTLGKDDHNLSRLKQYKILEKKNEEKGSFSSNIDFLRACDIKIKILPVEESLIPRVEELIQRTNQLNFTKKRINEQELREVINNPRYETGCVEAADNYGQYGIVGFFALDKQLKRLDHFLFSCRTMGMGIEQFIYSFLKCPDLEVVLPVSGNVNKNKSIPDYISLVNDIGDKKENSKPKNGLNILLKGPCDLEVMASYIENSPFMLNREFNFVDDNGNQADYYNHTVNILNYGKPETFEWCNKFSFLSEDAFHTELFTGKYDVICLSVLMDATLAVYENSRCSRLAYGIYSLPLSDVNVHDKYINNEVMTARSKFNREELLSFSKEFHQIIYAPEDIVDNISLIIRKIKDSKKDSKIVLILLSELEYKSRDAEYLKCYSEKHLIHRKINDLIKSKFSDDEAIYLLDVNKYIKTQADYFDSINHYSKYVYYNMAKEFAAYVNSLCDQKIEIASAFKAFFQNAKRMIYKRLFVK